jgi:predicted RNA-binding protein (virulence factor B family)
MVPAGQYYTLRVARQQEFGFYLDGLGQEILLPKRYAPPGLRPGQEVRVFVYHDSESRIIATTEQPRGVVGDIVVLSVVDVTAAGAYLDWGLMKDLFLPASQQKTRVRKGERVPVLIYLDERTGRVAATEKFSEHLGNDSLTVREQDRVRLLIYRRTDLGYEVIINGRHIGLLHDSDVFTHINLGDEYEGYIRQIRPDNKIDVMLGQSGYGRIEGESERVFGLLQEHKGFLPYHDRSSPGEIHAFFGMSKKSFKMAVGKLYKQQRIVLTADGIRLAGEAPDRDSPSKQELPQKE